MNRIRARELLNSSNVDPNSYSLEGGMPIEESYVLEIVEGGWSLFYSERGRRVGEKLFETEHAACNELLRLLLPHARLARAAASSVTVFFDVFEATVNIGLKVSEVWVGKPWDEYWFFDAAEVADYGLVEIRMKYGWRFSFYARAVWLSDDLSELEIICSQLACTSNVHSRRYDEGSLRFLISGTDKALALAKRSESILRESVQV